MEKSKKQFRLLQCSSIDELICHRNFDEYEGLSIPSDQGKWGSTLAVEGLTNWLMDGISNRYMQKANSKMSLNLVLLCLGRAINEGLKNALEHGNNWQIEKHVTIRWELKDSSIVFLISDEGKEAIDLNPKRNIVAPFILSEVYSGGGNGVNQIKYISRELGGSATWIAINGQNKDLQIGTALKIIIPAPPSFVPENTSVNDLSRRSE